MKNKVPAWVDRIVRAETISRPDVSWRHYSSKTWTSGHCYYGSGIVITCGKGSTRREQKITLLHEIAHWRNSARDGHGDNWARTYIELLRRYRIPVRNYEARRYNSVKRLLREERRSIAVPSA